MSVQVGVLLGGVKEIEQGRPWITDDGMLYTAVWVDNNASIQGTPEQMDRLATTLHAAAERARITEADLRAKFEQKQAGDA